ncbi:MAG: cyanophycinase [Planctomycetota bacterium]
MLGRPLTAAILLLFASTALPQTTGREQPRPIDQLFPGSLLICGGGKLPEEIYDRFMVLAGGNDAHIVVIPTASARANEDDGDNEESFLARWRELPHKSLRLLHTRQRKEANTDAFLAPLKTATGVWISGGQQGRLAAVYQGTKVEVELRALLRRGGVIGGTSAGAAISTKVMIQGGEQTPQIGTGFDLLPGFVVDQHFLKRRRLPRLQQAIADHPHLVGLGIDEGTALLVHKRRMRVLGKSVTLCLASTKHRKARQDTWRPGRRYDLVTWRQAALARAQERDFPHQPQKPLVKNGTCILIGGGLVGRDILREFVTAAGGPKANFLIVPTAQAGRRPSVGSMGGALRSFGAKNIQTLHATRREDVEKKENLDKIRRANAIWFTGGRQWRLVDAYGGTKALPLFHDVLKRGGVIAGSSAGCSIQAGYMVRGNPLGNQEIGMEGYERGFAFLPGVAADQHFRQRNRFGDMVKLMRRYPKLLGLGLDESTAIVARGKRFKILGAGKVAVFGVAGKQPHDYERFGAGTTFDVVTRKVVGGVR